MSAHQVLDYRDLIFNQWWTQIPGKADEKRTCKADAFTAIIQSPRRVRPKKMNLSNKANQCKWLFNNENLRDCRVTLFLPLLTVVQDF